MRNATKQLGVVFLISWACAYASLCIAQEADEYRSSLSKRITANISKSPEGGQLTVQFAVIAICKTAGVPYQWEKSQKLSGAKSRRFVRPVNARNVVAEKAIRDVLAGVGLSFEVDEGGLYLTQEPRTGGRRVPQNRSASKRRTMERVGKGLVILKRPPDDILPRMNLSKAEYVESFDILGEAIDRTYSFFDHKGIDWQEVQIRYRPKVRDVKSTEEFYRLLYEFIRELNDCHSWLCNYREGLNHPGFSPQVSTCIVDNKAVITEVNEGSEAYGKGLRRGSVIIEVDGLSVEETIRKLRPLLPMSSSERNFLDSAYRRLLDGEQGSKVALKFLPKPGESSSAVELTRIRWGKERAIQPVFPVDKDKFVWSGIHPSDYGYIRILSFSGRMEIAEEFDRALEKLKETPALIIDIRDNQGGFGTAQARIVGRFIAGKTKVAVSYKKNGPGHRAFAERETYFFPTGDWQYTQPIALLMNARTGSAADLFACYMISTGRPITVGTTTHGNLTGSGAYVVLPCNLVVRVSNGYVCDASGKVIEGNGNVPQIHAAPTIIDIVNGTDSVLERAVQSLQQTVKVRGGGAF
jgi:carboxyl-terminal processing protease